MHATRSVWPSSCQVSTNFSAVPLTSPEVHEENLLLATEMPDDRGKVVGHEGEVALAQGDPVAFAGHEVQEPLVVVHAAHDPPDPADGRQGRVVGVHGQPHTGPLGHRDNLAQEILERLPELFLADGAELARRRRCQFGGVELAHERTAPAGHRRGRRTQLKSVIHS